jgi:hypothetical protein
MTRVRGWGVVSSVAAPVLLIGGWTVAAQLQFGGFDPVTGTISALAAHGASHRWVMTAALAGVGVAHLITALALRPASMLSRCLFALGGAATVLVAANPLPADGANAPAHAAAAGVAFVSLAVWPATSWQSDPGSRPVRGRGRLDTPVPVPVPVPFRPAVALGASGVLLAAIGWFFAELFSGGDRVGLSERVAAGSQAIWPLVAVLLARRQPRLSPLHEPRAHRASEQDDAAARGAGASGVQDLGGLH